MRQAEDGREGCDGCPVPRWLDGETQRQDLVFRFRRLCSLPPSPAPPPCKHAADSAYKHTQSSSWSCGHTQAPSARSITRRPNLRNHTRRKALTKCQDPINTFLQPPHHSSNTPDTSDEKLIACELSTHISEKWKHHIPPDQTTFSSIW